MNTKAFSRLWLVAFMVAAATAVLYIVNLNLSEDREASILMFCTKQYDDRATLTSPNTYFGYPDACLDHFKSLID